MSPVPTSPTNDDSGHPAEGAWRTVVRGCR